MTIKKNPAKQTLDSFISAAPDAGAESSIEPKVPGFQQGKKQQISLTLDPEQLVRVEEQRKVLGMSRAGFISMAINNMLENGVTIPGRKG